MNHNCIKCGVPLVVGENVTRRQIDNYVHICRSCQRRCLREYRYRTGRQQPMNQNRECPQYLGVYVAERVLSNVFKNVERMPNGNPGFDFICGGGHKIDVKSSCIRVRENRTDQWMFNIKKNQTAEYFLCLAFDNRESLNPEHIWLIPASDVNDRVSISTSKTTLTKWDAHKLDMTKISVCCNIMKGESEQ